VSTSPPSPPDTSPDHVVEAFNRLGYDASFAAVAADLQCSPETLYALYQSREALGEAWLSAAIPRESDRTSVGGMFASFVFSVLGTLESRRDFGRAWVAALAVTGPLHLPQVRALHDQAHDYFVGWLDANEALISLPSGTALADVSSELADALCALALAFIVSWQADRSKQYGNTSATVESVAYLLDALLTRRDDFGQSGLLTHLVRIADQQHRQFIEPLLQVWLKPARAQRLADPVQWIEALRTLRPPPGPRA
jgi:hypothetical protein